MARVSLGLDTYLSSVKIQIAAMDQGADQGIGTSGIGSSSAIDAGACMDQIHECKHVFAECVSQYRELCEEVARYQEYEQGEAEGAYEGGYEGAYEGRYGGGYEGEGGYEGQGGYDGEYAGQHEGQHGAQYNDQYGGQYDEDGDRNEGREGGKDEGVLESNGEGEGGGDGDGNGEGENSPGKVSVDTSSMMASFTPRPNESNEGNESTQSRERKESNERSAEDVKSAMLQRMEDEMRATVCTCTRL